MIFSKNYHLQIAFILCVTLFTNCGNKNEKSESAEAQLVDTNISKLNSPELKSINSQILNNPNNPELYFERAKLYLNNKDFEASIADIKRSQKFDSVKADYYLVLTDAYFFGGQTRQAKEVLEKCIKLNPDHIDSKLKLAELFFYVKRYQDAFNFINDALKLNENNANAYYLKGMCYKEIGDSSKAVSSFATATEQDNNNYNAYLQLGLLHAAKKNALALEYYNNALRINSKSTEVIYNIGKFYQDMGKINEAIDTYKKLIQLDKNYKSAYYNLGAIEFSLKKNTDEAMRYFSEAINIDPAYAEAYFARGVCYEKKKDFVNAEADYQEALKHKPNYEFAVENLNRLKEKK